MTYRSENGSRNLFAYVITFLQLIVLAVAGYMMYRIDSSADILGKLQINQRVLMNFVEAHDRNNEIRSKQSEAIHHTPNHHRCSECKVR